MKRAKHITNQLKQKKHTFIAIHGNVLQQEIHQICDKNYIIKDTCTVNSLLNESTEFQDSAVLYQKVRI